MKIPFGPKNAPLLLLGFDIGSSSIKVALCDATTGSVLGIAQHPETEMAISSPQPDWAEQDPLDWWDAACMATRKLLAKTAARPRDIAGIGISYQMHGLVMLDEKGRVLRPAIIWCDSRAVEVGNQAAQTLGTDYCLAHYLNTPGNFTASKLRWVRENEPEIFARTHKVMLPGDYLAYLMSGEMHTTVTGLSEGVLWDFKHDGIAQRLLDHYGIPGKMLCDTVPVFSLQGNLRPDAAMALGLVAGIPIAYRAGDQPNNAMTLNVLRPGEVAATGGTSGVVYALAERPVFDPQQRVNSFAHVNYSPEYPITGVLLCINGAGSLYRWVREHIAAKGMSYPEMEVLAASVPIGSDGLCIMPFGNGAERMLNNQNQGARILGLQFNRHEARHLFRASLEGIAFAFVHGMQALQKMGIPIQMLRTGNDNLFQSTVFSETIATLMDVDIEVFETTGAVGAAKAAGVATGIFDSPEAAFGQNLSRIAQHRPQADSDQASADAYGRWLDNLAG